MRQLSWFLMVIPVLVGCGPRVIPIETAPVTGKATYNGKPLKDYRVFFFCDAAEAKEPATGLVQADGSFTLGVRRPDDGAIVGTNQVWLTYDPKLPEEVPGMETGTPPPKPTVTLPEKFKSAQSSGITVDVPKGGLKDYALELK